MADLPTFDDLFVAARDEVLARNSALTKDAVEREGTDANALIAAMSAVGDECVGALARAEAALFSDSATGTALDRLLIDRLNMFRKPAAAGFVTLDWTTIVANPAAFTIPAETRCATADGAQWSTLTDTNFPAGSTGPIRTAARSLSAGLTQQAKPTTITNIVDMPVGAAADLKVTNPLASAGADNPEEDEDYRGRSRQYFATAQRGTLAAIQAAAAAYPGVRRVSVFEIIDGDARPARTVQLVLADAFTDALVGQPTPGAYSTQSQVFAAQVVASLGEARACGIYVYAIVAQVVLQPVQLALTFVAGADVDQAAFAARQRVVGYMNSLSPGQRFSRADCAVSLQSVPGLVVSGAEVVSPAGDVVPRTLQVLRTQLGLVNAMSVQPDAALQGSTNPDGV